MRLRDAACRGVMRVWTTFTNTSGMSARSIAKMWRDL